MTLKTYCIALACCALAACDPRASAPPPAVSPPPATSPALAPDAVLVAARGFAAAEIEWQSAIAVGRALTARRVIRGSTAVTVRRWNADARRLIVVGKSTVDLGEKARAATALWALVGKLDAITGRK